MPQIECDVFFLFFDKVYRFDKEKLWIFQTLEEIGIVANEREYIKIPQQAFSLTRKQFNAGIIMKFISGLGKSEISLGITKEDIYFGDLNFVFGIASPTALSCVVSLCRLDPEFYGFPQDDELYYSRVKKEVIHEIGHVLGLLHCEKPTCVMSFSNSIYDVDRKTKFFCENCSKLIRGKRV
jgi:archaemetzincin